MKKFNAWGNTWDNGKKRWLNPSNVTLLGDGTITYWDDDNDPDEEAEIEIVFFTGLYDKDKKEIYEGDFISVRSDEPAPGGGYYCGTSGYYGREIVTIAEDGQALLDSCGSLRSSLNLFSQLASGYKIIGNVFDNPDMMEVREDNKRWNGRKWIDTKEAQ